MTIAVNSTFYMELNDRIYAWVNRQVAIASIRPTATPEQGIPGLGGFGGGGFQVAQ